MFHPITLFFCELEDRHYWTSVVEASVYLEDTNFEGCMVCEAAPYRTLTGYASLLQLLSTVEPSSTAARICRKPKLKDKVIPRQ
jgi:hypothetical protein